MKRTLDLQERLEGRSNSVAEFITFDGTEKKYPKRFLEYCAHAAALGAHFSRRLECVNHCVEHAEAIREGEELLRTPEPRYLIFHTPNEVCALFYQSLFWFGAYVVLRLDTGKALPAFSHSHQFGAMAQNNLTQALIRASDAVREQVYHLFTHNIPLIQSTWRTTFYGSMAVARAATSLRVIGVPSALASWNVDTVHKIDLIGVLDVQLPELLCLQIKSAGRAPSSYVEPLEIARLSKTQSSADILKMQEGMATFTQRYVLAPRPALAHVSPGLSRPWEINHLENLTSVFTELLPRLTA